MKNLTVLEKRLKRAHEYRQNVLERQKIYPVASYGHQGTGQYTPIHSDEKLRATGKLKTELMEWLGSIRHSLQNIRWKPMGVKRVMFALALIVIVLIILNSRF
jgi:hypothetical protein